MLKVQTLIVTKSLSMKFLSSKCKKLWTKERIETFWVNNSQIKARIEPQEAVSWISHTQNFQKLLPDYNFQSNQIYFLTIKNLGEWISSSLLY